MAKGFKTKMTHTALRQNDCSLRICDLTEDRHYTTIVEKED